MSRKYTYEHPLRVAVIGAGPAGFYTAAELRKKIPDIHIGIFDRLFAPYGLVRYGVAPDHAHTRRVLRAFEKTLANSQVAFWGGVNVGYHVSIAELQTYFDAILVSSGAEQDRQLGIPGEDLAGCISSMEMVGWYNAHPDYHNLQVDLSCEAAAIIGNGNVALDVARFLMKPADQWAGTDVALAALHALTRSAIRDVHIIGRRGPAQTSFRQNELFEIGEMKDCNICINPEDLELSLHDLEEIESHDGLTHRQVVELFRELAGRPHDPARTRNLHFHFCKSPVGVLGTQKVSGIRLERNRLSGPAGRQKPLATGTIEELACGLIAACIGHTAVSLPGLPLDKTAGHIPVKAGRIIEHGSPLPGQYATGWIARGADGLIGNNKPDALETAQAIWEDSPDLTACPTPDNDALRTLLAERNCYPVSFEEWEKIDDEEVRRGAAHNLARVKFTGTEEARTWLDQMTTEASS